QPAASHRGAPGRRGGLRWPIGISAHSHGRPMTEHQPRRDSAPRASTAGGSAGSSPRASTAGGSAGSPPRASTAGGSAGSPPRASTAGRHFTGRAAVLAVVLCGIALSLAYPVREYISQRKQIDQLLAQSFQIQEQRKRLESERKLLHSPVYIAQ